MIESRSSDDRLRRVIGVWAAPISTAFYWACSRTR